MNLEHPSMKIILILLDGLGDRSYSSLNDQTPLQAAKTPNLDRLAQLGGNGLYHAAALGQCLPSENAHFLIFGYDLERFPGRGLLEAVGWEIPFHDEDGLFLAHLAGAKWREDEPILVHGKKEIAADIEETSLLYEAVAEYETGGIRFKLHQTGHNDAILVLRGPVSPFVSDSDPMVRGFSLARIHPLSENPEPRRSARTAHALNAYLSYCHKVFSGHELNLRRQAAGHKVANFLVTQRGGRRIRQQSFLQRWGLSGMLIASGVVYGGLAQELGFTFVRATDSSDPGKDLEERIQWALSDTSHDFFHVHTKAPDEAAHKEGPEEKAAVIERLDSGLNKLVKIAEKQTDLLVVVMADHSTPSRSLLIHSGESVPIVMVGSTVRRDDVESFNEVSAAGGCLGLLRGHEVMTNILNFADRAALQGHHLGPVKRPYVARDYEPFKLTD